MKLPTDLMPDPVDDGRDPLAFALASGNAFQKLISDLTKASGSNALRLIANAIDGVDATELASIARELEPTDAINQLKTALLPRLARDLQEWRRKVPHYLNEAYRIELDELKRMYERIGEMKPIPESAGAIRMLQESLSYYVQGDLREEITMVLDGNGRNYAKELALMKDIIERRMREISTNLQISAS